MISGWKNIDKNLRHLCQTTQKSEKIRLLNIIGAQRSRIFQRMGLVFERSDLEPFKIRSKRLFKMIESLLDIFQKIKLQ